jgi:hypothetical protein
MAKPIHEMSTWGHSRHHSRLPDEEWQATRELTQMQTQVMGNRDEYLASTSRDIGRRVSDDTHELFVVCDPADALLQQLQHLTPDLIAVHDIASDSSRRLLAGLAAATRSKVQKLLIRRQGFGLPLATMEFAELPGASGQTLRVYTTIADADSQQRQRIASVLLGHAKLAVVIAGDLPPHALDTALEPLHEGIRKGPWTNRNMLMVPLGGSTALAAAASRMSARSPVVVRVTPQAMKPGDAWGYISLAWDRIRKTGSVAPPSTQAYGLPDQSVAFQPAAPKQAAAAPVVSTPVPAPAQASAPLPMQPMPAVRKAAPAVERGSTWAAMVHDCASLPGVVSCVVLDFLTHRTLAHAGSKPGPAALASHGGGLWEAMLEATRQLGLPAGAMEASITLAGHHLVMRALPGQGQIGLIVVMDRVATDLAHVQAKLSSLHQRAPEVPVLTH